MGRGVEPLALRPTPAKTQLSGSIDFLMPRKTHPTTPARLACWSTVCSYSTGGRYPSAECRRFSLWREFVYLAVVLDAFSRRLIGWSLGRTLEAQLPLAALRMALQTRDPPVLEIKQFDERKSNGSPPFRPNRLLPGAAKRQFALPNTGRRFFRVPCVKPQNRGL